MSVPRFLGGYSGFPQGQDNNLLFLICAFLPWSLMRKSTLFPSTPRPIAPTIIKQLSHLLEAFSACLLTISAYLLPLLVAMV